MVDILIYMRFHFHQFLMPSELVSYNILAMELIRVSRIERHVYYLDKLKVLEHKHGTSRILLNPTKYSDSPKFEG